MQRTPSAIPLFGASTMAQLDDILGALDVTLTAEQMERLTQAGA